MVLARRSQVMKVGDDDVGATGGGELYLTTDFAFSSSEAIPFDAARRGSAVDAPSIVVPSTSYWTVRAGATIEAIVYNSVGFFVVTIPSIISAIRSVARLIGTGIDAAVCDDAPSSVIVFRDEFSPFPPADPLADRGCGPWSSGDYTPPLIPPPWCVTVGFMPAAWSLTNKWLPTRDELEPQFDDQTFRIAGVQSGDEADMEVSIGFEGEGFLGTGTIPWRWQAIWVRAQIFPDAQRVKVWYQDETEPADWLIDVSGTFAYKFGNLLWVSHAPGEISAIAVGATDDPIPVLVWGSDGAGSTNYWGGTQAESWRVTYQHSGDYIEDAVQTSEIGSHSYDRLLWGATGIQYSEERQFTAFYIPPFVTKARYRGRVFVQQRNTAFEGPAPSGEGGIPIEIQACYGQDGTSLNAPSATTIFSTTLTEYNINPSWPGGPTYYEDMDVTFDVTPDSYLQLSGIISTSIISSHLASPGCCWSTPDGPVTGRRMELIVDNGTLELIFEGAATAAACGSTDDLPGRVLVPQKVRVKGRKRVGLEATTAVTVGVATIGAVGASVKADIGTYLSVDP